MQADADAERFLLMEAVVALLALASDEAPIIVVLDDLHWADAASISLLRHVVSADAPLRVLILGTYRPSDLSRGGPLTAFLAYSHRESKASRIELTGLADTEVIDLVETAAGYKLDDEGIGLAHALRRETDGNPFFVAELLRHLGESGAFTLDSTGRFSLATGLDNLGLPPSVRDVVVQRVSRLGEEVARVLSLASVVGREFDADLLVNLSGEDDELVLDMLEKATGAALVEESGESGRYRFVHSLIQHTLYNDLSTSRRQLLHQRIAKALEDAGAAGEGRIEELAHHWMAATRLADAGKAVRYAQLAGERALEAFAPVDAASWFSQALDVLSREQAPDEGTRCALLIGLGTAQRQTGEVEHYETIRQAGRIALSLGDRDLLVQVAFSRTSGLETVSAEDSDRMEVLEAALSAVGPEDSALRARLLACLCEETDIRNVDKRNAIGKDAVEVARRTGDDDVLLKTLVMALAADARSPDTLDLRMDNSRLALELAARVGDLTSRFEALGDRIIQCTEAAAFEEVWIRLAELEEVVKQTRLPYQRYVFAYTRCGFDILTGQTADLEAEAARVFELGTSIGVHYALAVYGAALMRLKLEQGRLSEIAEMIGEAEKTYTTLPAYRQSVMFVNCKLGRLDEARRQFEADFEQQFADTSFNMLWFQTMSHWSDCAADMGRVDAAPLLYERLAPYADRFMWTGSFDLGPTARPLGRVATLLGLFDAAEEHLYTALEIVERIPAPYWVARTKLDVAEMHLARRGHGDADAARQRIDEAHTVADERGYRGLLPDAHRLLKQL